MEGVGEVGRGRQRRGGRGMGSERRVKRGKDRRGTYSHSIGILLPPETLRPLPPHLILGQHLHQPIVLAHSLGELPLLLPVFPLPSTPTPTSDPTPKPTCPAAHYQAPRLKPQLVLDFRQVGPQGGEVPDDLGGGGGRWFEGEGEDAGALEQERGGGGQTVLDRREGHGGLGGAGWICRSGLRGEGVMRGMDMNTV